MKKIGTRSLQIFALLIGMRAGAQELPVKFSLIPLPLKVQAGKGSFVMSQETAIVLPKSGLFRQEARQLNEIIKNASGYALLVQPQRTNRIRFVRDSSIVSPEGYRLTISEKEVLLAANQGAGIFMGIQTIRQLLPAFCEKKGIGSRINDPRYSDRHKKRSVVFLLPVVSIEDEPAYSWRGMHLDVARHFFSIGYLRKFIDVMALYKMNKLHLHLTDDQGWRIEIKNYPKLTEEGAWRVFNNQDSACMKKAQDDPDFAIDPSHIIHRNGKTLYGGYYTQQQMKELVVYAAKRHITIIPEIDMPGHMMAAINAYPVLTCNGDNKWGSIFTTPICPCNETTFEFAENVFSEIMDIFPSEYIHIGGDEVDRSDWGRSEACKALMKKEGIPDLPALQSYFIRRMEKFFTSKGRRLIGWDEILEGGISPTAIVMYWRSWVPTAPLKAIRNGNAVIMTPGSPLYFDRPADRNSLSEVYHFDPVPQGLSVTEARSIIGAQANSWTEDIPSENRAEYMVMPRMTALAERLWTNRVDDYDSYLQRLRGQYERLDSLKIHYRLPDLEGMISQNVFVDRDTLRIKKSMPGMEIRYTTGGSAPRRNSKLLSGPLIIGQSCLVRVEAFAPGGLKGDVYDLHFERQALAAPVEGTPLQPGLTASYYKGSFSSTRSLIGTRSDSSFVTDKIAVPSSVNAPAFGIVYSGFIKFPSDGIYNFYLTSDDGAVLKIAGRETINNDGLHSAIEKSGQAAVRKGLQRFELDFIEGGGGYTLKLEYSKDGADRMEIPAAWFGHTVEHRSPKPYGVLPSSSQLRWQETEMYCIVHFSVATYTDKEWGYGDEDPGIFDPAAFSAGQIVGAAKAGGFGGIVVVAKHHDGFCLWPTKTTAHNISASPYRSGKGDLLKEYRSACDSQGMKMGVYCSPWDRNSALYGKPDYVTQIYRPQLKELYTNYGPLFLSWHDGANGGDGYYGGAREVRNIDRSSYYGWDTTWAVTRTLQPGACIFGDVGPDVRWVGNEEGHAGETCWATYTPHAPDKGKLPANGYVLDQEGTEGTRNGKYWMPAECDVPLRPGWFYHASEDGRSKPAQALLDLYYKSVGRGACLDLGLSPDKKGRLSDEDVRILERFGNLLKETFTINLASGAGLVASNVRDGGDHRFVPENILDQDRYTYWATDDSVTRPMLLIDLPEARSFNVVRLRENIKLGQRIEGAAVDIWTGGDWKEIASVTSIGANRLIRLPAPVTAKRLRLRITASPVCIALSDFALFREPG